MIIQVLIYLFSFIYQRIRMGNNHVEKAATLTFVQALEDNHFGEVEIYRSIEGLFIMKVNRTGISDDEGHLQNLRIIELIMEQKISNIIPIVCTKRTQEKGFCGKYERVEIYTEYYNFTLADLALTNKQLEQSQLWLIFYSLLRLIQTLKLHQVTMDIKLSNIFLTPAGLPCMYHFHLQSCKKIIICSDMTLGQNLAKLMLELTLGPSLDSYSHEFKIKQQVFTRVITKFKLLGSAIRDLMTLRKTQNDVLQIIEDLKEDDLIVVAKEVKLLKFKYYLPQNSQGLNLPVFPNPSYESSSKTQKQNKYANPHSKSIGKIKNLPSSHLKSQQQGRKTFTTQQSRMRERNSELNYSTKIKKSQQGDCFIQSKQQTNKILNELDRKKQEYRLQRQKFQMRKELLLQGDNQKQNQFQTLLHKSCKRKQQKNKKYSQNTKIQRLR